MIDAGKRGMPRGGGGVQGLTYKNINQGAGSVKPRGVKQHPHPSQEVAFLFYLTLTAQGCSVKKKLGTFFPPQTVNVSMKGPHHRPKRRWTRHNKTTRSSSLKRFTTHPSGFISPPTAFSGRLFVKILKILD